jgi:hypothetical protein
VLMFVFGFFVGGTLGLLLAGVLHAARHGCGGKDPTPPRDR